MTLPPLPEPVNARDVGTLLRDPTSPWPYIQPPLYTATQMHAYARAAVEAEREACARACEAVTANARQQDGYDGDYESGIEVGGDMCATAIRARGAKEQGNSNG